MGHSLSITPVSEFAQGPLAKEQSKACCSLPMNRTRKLLEMNECSKTGSWAQGAIKVRGDLSLRERVRVRGNGANKPTRVSDYSGNVELDKLSGEAGGFSK